MSGRNIITAEVGINHNGSTLVALELMAAAKEAGADLVKFQKRQPRVSVPKHLWDRPRETPWGTLSYIEYKERIEDVDWKLIAAESAAREIPWFASVWDIPSVDFMEGFDPPYHKVPSPMLTNDGLIQAACETGRPIILSTGMSTEAEIRHAVGLLDKHAYHYILCHCNSTYPCPVADLNLSRILTLQKMFPGVPIGYSGHEVGLATTLAAVALGVCYIERHITLDRAMWGSDQAASVEADGFRRLVHDIRNIEKAMGDGIIRVMPREERKRSELRGVYA